MLMNFDELLAILPSCPGPENLPLKASDEFRYVEIERPFFVPPPLALHDDLGGDAEPTVLLLSAPGAVGKSTLADVIAHRKRAPLWDLAREGPVGSHSLEGRVLRSFGIQGFGEMSRALDSGEFFLVIDALDEGRVKTNEEAFQTFIFDLAAMARGGKGPRFVLLGRTQVTEIAWLVLQDAGVRCAVHTIQPFDEASALEYVDRRVSSAKGGDPAVREDSQPYRAARDAILSRLRDAITSGREAVEEREVRDFLGYAPVLDAVATLLGRESNYERLRESFVRAQAEGRRGRPIAILADIVGHILRREQEEKLIRNIQPEIANRASALGLTLPRGRQGGSVFDELYTPDEQSARLVAHVVGVKRSFEIPLPAKLADFYEEQVAAFLAEHPFLREGGRPANTVFESYLFAQAMVTADNGMKVAVDRYLESDAYKPSSLLAHFFFLLADQSGSRQIRPEHIGILYASLRAGESDISRVRLSVDGGEPSAEGELEEIVEADVEFELLPRGSAAERGEVRETFFTNLQRESSIRFARDAGNLQITAPCTVVLGASGREAILGPGVYIDCARLQVLAARLAIVGAVRSASDTTNDEGVVLRALSYEGSVQKPIVHGRLEVSWPGSDTYPWTEFSVAEPLRGLPEGPLKDAYRRFRRIASTLRSHKKGALGRFRGKIEHQRVLKGEIGRALLEKLRADEVLVLVDNFYFWNAERAADRVGVTWLDLRHSQTSEKLLAYLTAFVKDNGDLFT